MTTARRLPLYHVDAFTKSAFGGNPAAVCLVAGGKHSLTDDVMQKIGAEMNLSETAFILSDGDEKSFKTDSKFGLRWFTPTTEVNLCGHATLASAAVLFHKIELQDWTTNKRDQNEVFLRGISEIQRETTSRDCKLGNESEEIYFETLSGTLTTRRQDRLISMDFPLNTPEKQDKSELDSLLKVVVKGDLIKEVEFSPTTRKLLVRLVDTTTRSELENLQPKILLMVESEGTGKVRGVIVTLRGSQANGAVDEQGRVYDFISRYFAPWVGIPEDPVTGSAHTVLAGYWSKQLDKDELYARQCSPRGGDLNIRVEGDRVHLAGEAAVIVQGTLQI